MCPDAHHTSSLMSCPISTSFGRNQTITSRKFNRPDVKRPCLTAESIRARPEISAERSGVKVPHVRRRSAGVAAVKAHVSQSQLRAEPHLHAWWPRAESLSGETSLVSYSPAHLVSSSRSRSLKLVGVTGPCDSSTPLACVRVFVGR